MKNNRRWLIRSYLPEKQEQTLLSETSWLWNVSGHVSIKPCCPQINTANHVQRLSPGIWLRLQASTVISFDRHLKYISSYLAFNLLQHVSRKKETLRYLSESQSEITVPTHTARVSKCHDLIICADLILSSCRLAISFKETPRVKSVGGFFVATALSQPYIHLSGVAAACLAARKQVFEARRGQIRNQQDVSSLLKEVWASYRLSASLPCIWGVADGLQSSPGV